MLTDSVGQEFNQSRVDFFISALKMFADLIEKTQRLEVTHCLGAGIIWRHLHPHIWQLMLAIDKQLS